MRSNRLSKLQTLLMATDRYRNWFILIIILLLPSIYILVYFTGGTKNVYAHIAYILIVIAGAMLDVYGGMITGLVAGIILGPFMPLDVVAGEAQYAFNWHFRALMFVFVGGFSGYITAALRKNANTILDLMCHNPETEIPNINIFNNTAMLSYDKRNQLVISLLINNYDKIIDLVGLSVYYRLLNKIYKVLRDGLPKTTLIIQCNNNKLWLATPFEDQEEDTQRIIKLLSEGIKLENVEYYVEYSFGISFALNQEQCYQISTYIKSDDAARFAQKNNLLYTKHKKSIERKMYDVKILGEFIQALSKNEIVLFYQPKISLETNKSAGLEALIRWYHPERGLLMPQDFIPLIEETQLIHQLTEWVLRRVITKIREFQKENLDVQISMNVSVKNIFDKDNYQRTAKIIKQNADIVDNIEFEIVETVLMENIEETIEILNLYKQIGISFSVDDFGRGYSSLAYLHRLPIECVKIDRSFTKNLNIDRASQNILKAMVNLCHELNYQVVLEGVEDEATAIIAKNLNSDYAQGFYYAYPIADDKIINWYKNQLNKTLS
ncbi:MAG: EAL domain-containing protein [Bacilli bacterium]|nr:EAL domain-containing protein [Bacilli bacterium]